jgi:4-amino-4-deoxy-L-arabinose transferase-like glycosyltransferase
MPEPGNDGAIDWKGWARDRWLWWAFGVGLVLRVLPMLLWPQFECIRDECIYRGMAEAINNGRGLTVSNKGWLPSPGYPYALAWSRTLFGTYFSIKIPQIILSQITIYLGYVLGRQVVDQRVGRTLAWLFALHPTLAWFTNTQWIETFYIFFLMAAITFLVAARSASSWAWAAGSGVTLGLAMLFKGVATYMPPFFLLAAVYPRDETKLLSPKAWFDEARRRSGLIIGFVVALLLTVAPYSVHASKRHGGFLVVDATVGHVLFLGNNDFPPLTFDYGIGMLTQPLFGKYLRAGRRPCPRNVPPVRSSKCEVDAVVDWIADNPDKFAERVPVRLAQLFNPNSFLTRHIRWGMWGGLPWLLKEGLAVWIVVWSVAITWGGTVAAWARARGPYALMAVSSVVYTIFTTVMSYGMTRFRLPLEALWLFYLALLFAQPRETLQALRDSPLRATGALLTLPPLVALTLWYLPTGFPMFW